MVIIWGIVLVIYGIVNGWGSIPLLNWWLLLPMAIQDRYDVTRKSK
jgi:hypothetical protein